MSRALKRKGRAQAPAHARRRVQRFAEFWILAFCNVHRAVGKRTPSASNAEFRAGLSRAAKRTVASAGAMRAAQRAQDFVQLRKEA